jgi:hypothetical protein
LGQRTDDRLDGSAGKRDSRGGKSREYGGVAKATPVSNQPASRQMLTQESRSIL